MNQRISSEQALNTREKQLFWGIVLFYLLVTVCSMNLPFFSDGIVQSSMAAQWFYDHNFQYFFIPDDRNPGHPPFWGMYLAGWWKVLGQKLWVSHLAMLPFLIGIAWNYLRVARYFVRGRLLVFAMLFLAIEPTLLAMSTQVSPDIVMNFLFFLALSGLLYNRQGIQTLAMCGLPLLNTRGSMLVAVIFLIEIVLGRLETGRKLRLTLIWKYLVVGLVIAAWLGVHYLENGWIGYNRGEMPWRKAFEPVGVTGYVRNWAILGWRFLDFGRLALWIVAGVIFIKMLIKKAKPEKPLLLLIGFTLSQVLVFGPVLTRYVATLQHRYLIPAFILFSLTVVIGLKQFERKATQYLFFVLMAVSLLAGHFWVYPDKISQGWEASLAHVPYFQAREQIMEYIHENEINPDQVTTGTPLKYRYMDTNLQPKNWKMTDHDEVDINDYPFALYSNISNDWPDETYDLMHKEWELVVEQRSRWIVMRLFRNPKMQGH